jgi:putative ABC transport system permease protein
VADLRPFRESLSGNIGFVLFRIGALQATAMSVLGLVLAVIGVYGVVSYRTSQRSREIGIRMALGAAPRDVRRLVLGQGAMLVIAGVGTGLLLALALTQTLEKIVLFVSAADPLTFASVTALLSASALLACYLPARRAMRVEPVVALRHE